MWKRSKPIFPRSSICGDSMNSSASAWAGENTVDLGGIKNNFGITFEAPRHSLMTAIENEIFDDLLIGNFMRTTLHGHRPVRPLYPDFTPYVAKYADNGRAKTYDELEAYFAAYRRRAPLDHFFHSLQNRSAGIL